MPASSAKELARQAQAPLPALTPAAMLDRAVTGNADVAVIEKLMGLQERWEANQARRAYNAAIAAARAEIPVIFKSQTKTGAGGTYQYETLADIAKVVDPILAAHDLSYHYQSESNGEVKVTCVISHADGHSESNSLSVKPDVSGSKNPVQALGSAVTYLQRYTLKLALGLATSKDDDGASAGGPVPPRPSGLKPGPYVEHVTEDGEVVLLVSAAQRDELIALADDCGVDKAAFCKHFNIPSLADVPAAAFDKAKTAMQAAKKKRSG